MITRQEIYDALFCILQTLPGFATCEKRLKFPADVASQPAIFLRRADDEYLPRESQNLPANVVLEAQIIIYYKTDDKNEAPGEELDRLIELVEQALIPPAWVGVMNLNGMVQHLWIEGTIKKDDGALSGQAGAIIPIKIRTTSNGPN